MYLKWVSRKKKKKKKKNEKNEKNEKMKKNEKKWKKWKNEKNEILPSNEIENVFPKLFPPFSHSFVRH